MEINTVVEWNVLFLHGEVLLQFSMIFVSLQ